MSYLNSLTRLLAEENLIIVEGNFKTASIDIKTRVVRLPSHYTQDIHVQVLFRAHEVGHALYTPFDALHDMLEKQKKYARVLFPYINICEDVRIEKMIQMKFPGLRKDFDLGYQTLIDKEMFGKRFKKGHKNDQHFADRLNYFFKVGAERSGVIFTPVEKQIVDLVDSCITFDETLEAAKVLYEYCKEQSQQQEQQSGFSYHETDEDDDEAGEGSGGEGDQNGEDDDSEGNGPGSGDEESDGDDSEGEGDGDGDSEKGSEESNDGKDGKGGSSPKGGKSSKEQLQDLKKKTKNKNYHNESEKDAPPEPETFKEKEDASEGLATAVSSTCFSPNPITFRKFLSYKNFT